MTRSNIPTNYAALREYAQKIAELHYWTACHESADIAFYQAKPYAHTQAILKSAIRAAWPQLGESGTERIYDMWVENGESLAYCVEYHERNLRDEADVNDQYMLEDIKNENL